MGVFDKVGDWFQDEVIDPVREGADALLPEAVKDDPWQAAISVAAAPFTGGMSLWGLAPYAAESANWLPEGMGADLSTAILAMNAIGAMGNAGMTLPGFGEGGMFAGGGGAGGWEGWGIGENLPTGWGVSGGGGGIGDILSFLPGFGEGFGGNILGNVLDFIIPGGEAADIWSIIGDMGGIEGLGGEDFDILDLIGAYSSGVYYYILYSPELIELNEKKLIQAKIISQIRT